MGLPSGCLSPDALSLFQSLPFFRSQNRRKGIGDLYNIQGRIAFAGLATTIPIFIIAALKDLARRKNKVSLNMFYLV
jgi:hypothetical protein